MTALLIMGALVLLVCGGMLVYFYSLQTRYYDVVASSLGRVDEIRVVESPTFVAAAGTSADTPPAEPLAIEGNKVIAVGRRSAEFTVVSGAPSADAEVRWRVEPANAASLAAGTGLPFSSSKLALRNMRLTDSLGWAPLLNQCVTRSALSSTVSGSVRGS